MTAPTERSVKPRMHQPDLQRYDWAADSAANGPHPPAAPSEASARNARGAASPVTLALPNRWLQGLLFATALLCCSYALLRQTPFPDWFANSDKLGHLGAFLALVLLARFATPRRGASFPLLLGALLALAMGAEWIQAAILPLRHADAWDLAANLGGCALGLAAAVVCDRLGLGGGQRAEGSGQQKSR